MLSFGPVYMWVFVCNRKNFALCLTYILKHKYGLKLHIQYFYVSAVCVNMHIFSA